MQKKTINILSAKLKQMPAGDLLFDDAVYLIIQYGGNFLKKSMGSHAGLYFSAEFARKKRP